jgi:glycosyltransferase involved in cell wall biosynthesis
MLPQVSVIIPTYKHQDYVLATLDSVFAQTFMDYEVIVVNDGSPDSTAQLLQPLAAAGRIRYIEQANAGQAAARNRGIAEAQGEFIALLDDDDLWPPDKLEWQVAAMAKNPAAGVIVGTAEVVDTSSGKRWTKDLSLEITFEELFQGNPIWSPGQTLIRASLLKQLDGLDATVWGADDWDLWFRATKASRIIAENRIALFYMLHATNASKQLCRMLDNSCLVVDIHLLEVANNNRYAMRLIAYQALYHYLGVSLINQAKATAKARRIRALLPYLKSLTKLLRVLIKDRSSARCFFKDFLPQSVRRQISVMKPSL